MLNLLYNHKIKLLPKELTLTLKSTPLLKRKPLIGSGGRNRDLSLEARTKVVPVDGIDMTSANDEKPYLATTGLCSCIGIAVYDPENKVGGVAHVYLLRQRECDEEEHLGTTGRLGRVAHFTRLLVGEADNLGGETYKLYFFNVNSPFRPTEQTNQLTDLIRRTVEELKQSGRIVDVEYRDEQTFRLDTGTGAILPY